MSEFLASPAMRSALIGGVLVALLAGYYGVFVVQRGLSFLGNGLAHSAFGGVAVGILLGWAPLYTAIPFTIGVALLITTIKNKTKLAADTVIGIFFAVSMAIGIICLSQTTNYAYNASSYLFGNILLLSSQDIWMAAGLFGLTVCLLPLWKRWAYAAFDEEMARSDGVPVLFDEYLLSTLIAITVVCAIKIVGIVLISSFLVIPAAGARLICRRFSSMTLVSLLISTFSTVLGLLLSYEMNIPGGATIVLCQAGLFLLCITMRRTN